MDSNKDLLMCENKFYLEKNTLYNLLNFNKSKDEKKPTELKTEKVTSNVLLQVKSFLEKTKNEPKCINIEEESDDDEESDTKNKRKIQLDLMLFEHELSSSSSDKGDNDDDDSSGEE